MRLAYCCKCNYNGCSCNCQDIKLHLQLSARYYAFEISLTLVDMSKLNIFEFMPFRLYRLGIEVSNEMTKVYQDRFDIDVVEWRILVTLSQSEPCSAQHVARSTRTHKSRISRGVKRLLNIGLIKAQGSKEDAREITLRRTAKGRNMYEKMEPLILEKEKSLLACLSKDERKRFATMVAKLEDHLGLEQSVDKA